LCSCQKLFQKENPSQHCMKSEKDDAKVDSLACSLVVWWGKRPRKVLHLQLLLTLITKHHFLKPALKISDTRIAITPPSLERFLLVNQHKAITPCQTLLYKTQLSSLFNAHFHTVIAFFLFYNYYSFNIFLVFLHY
jgi:hypothetical protein